MPGLGLRQQSCAHRVAQSHRILSERRRLHVWNQGVRWALLLLKPAGDSLPLPSFPWFWAVSGSPWLAAARLQAQSLGSRARLPKWVCLPVAICLGREACQTEDAPYPTMTPS